MKNQWLVGLLLVLGAHIVCASSIEVREFKSKAQEQRYKTLIDKIRCITCANQSIAESNATIAGSLRAVVYQQMKQGKSEKQIINFLVARYGDYVMYDPPFKLSTAFVWIGPFVFLLIAWWVMRRVIRARALSNMTETSLSADEQARLKSLLEEKSS